MVNHSVEFVDRNRPWLHTQTIEGSWQQLKAWTNYYGGCRDYMVDERLEEYKFFTEYLTKDKGLAWWRMLRVIAEKGIEAQELIKGFARFEGLTTVYREDVAELDASDNDSDVEMQDDDIPPNPPVE